MEIATVIVQGSDLANLTNFGYRDECMASNVEMILRNYPNEKVILWAHSGHLSKQKGWMGGHLIEKYGASYYNVNFLSHRGTYGPSKRVLKSCEPGSFEYSFHKTGVPNYFFDFSMVTDQEPESQWLNKRLYCRSIGYQHEHQFLDEYLSRNFNAFIYIDSTSASHYMGR